MTDERSLTTWTQIIYGLHALSLLTGILGKLILFLLLDKIGFSRAT